MRNRLIVVAILMIFFVSFFFFLFKRFNYITIIKACSSFITVFSEFIEEFYPNAFQPLLVPNRTTY